MAGKIYDVLGIGGALVDVISSVENTFILEQGLTRGTAVLIDTARATELYALMPAGIQISGGCAANTMAGIASLGGRAAFIGKVADDELGAVFRRDLIAAGVVYDTAPAPNGLPTGRCLILVSPDGERTTNTYMGATSLLSASDIDEEKIAASKVIYTEGYVFDLPETTLAVYRASEIATRAGCKIALNLSDRICIENHRAEFERFINQRPDIVFGNEGEVRALYRTEDLMDAIRKLALKVGIACVTRGAKGSLICIGDETFEVPSIPVNKVVDTTGAGDLYAAGFLYGYTQGLTLAECGHIASVAAAEIITHMGARPQMNLAKLFGPRPHLDLLNPGWQTYP